MTDEGAICQCGHIFFDHEGETGGMCLKPGCSCLEFRDRPMLDGLTLFAAMLMILSLSFF